MKKRTINIFIVIILFLGLLSLTIKKQPSARAINYTEDMYISQINETPINYALSFYGVSEMFSDGKPSYLVASFFEDFVSGYINPTTTPWCSAFVNTIFSSTGYEYSGKLNARSWLKVGEPIKDPQVGDVAVFWRGNPKSWTGHVGIFIGWSQDKKYINILGGNQKNTVSIQPYPIKQLIEFRRPKQVRKNISDSQYTLPIKIKLIDAE